MEVRKVMSRPVHSVRPRTTIREAAGLMRKYDVGVLAVEENGLPIGIVTDRDIVIRILPEWPDAGTRPVSDAMSLAPISCFADQDVSLAAVIMGDEQIRRLPVLSRSNRLVGILSIGDIAEDVSEELAGEALGEICEGRARPTRERRVRRPE